MWKKKVLARYIIAIFQDDKHCNNYLLFLGNNSTGKPSNVLFPWSVSSSHDESIWEFAIGAWCDIHYSLISCNLSTLLTPFPQNSHHCKYNTPPQHKHSLSVLNAVTDFVFCLFMILKKSEHIRKKWLSNHKRKLLLHRWITFLLIGYSFSVNFTGWVKGGTVLSVISFYFVVSPCQSQINVVQLTDRATFLTNHCNPAREPSLSSDVPLYLKQSWGVRVWGAGKKEKEKERSHGPAIIILFWFFSSHSLIPLMKSGQAEACSRRQQFHFTICASHMAGRRGVCRQHSQEKEERKKIHDMKSRTGSSRVHWYPVMFRLQHPLNAPLETRLSCMHPCKNTLNKACHEWYFGPSQINNTYAGKHMSQVLTQKEPGTHTKWWWAQCCFAPPYTEYVVPTPRSHD